MKVTFAHLCDKAFIDQDGKIGLVGIFDIIKAPEFPIRHVEAHLAVGLLTEAGDRERDHEWLVTTIGPNDDVVASFGFKGRPRNEVGAVEKILLTVSDMVFERPGRYELRFTVDGAIQAVVLPLTAQLVPEGGR